MDMTLAYRLLAVNSHEYPTIHTFHFEDSALGINFSCCDSREIFNRKLVHAQFKGGYKYLTQFN